ncbi:MAG: hypothetical protein V4487_02015 [Chlamydiota bacterium]
MGGIPNFPSLTASLVTFGASLAGVGFVKTKNAPNCAHKALGLAYLAIGVGYVGLGALNEFVHYSLRNEDQNTSDRGCIEGVKNGVSYIDFATGSKVQKGLPPFKEGQHFTHVTSNYDVFGGAIVPSYCWFHLTKLGQEVWESGISSLATFSISKFNPTNLCPSGYFAKLIPRRPD